jgi:fluoride ion exporter CrcB/FEX
MKARDFVPLNLLEVEKSSNNDNDTHSSFSTLFPPLRDLVGRVNQQLAMTGLIPSDALAIGLGAVVGAMSRYHAGRVAAEYIATDPRLHKLQGWHTAGINVVGSFILGGVAGAPMKPSTPVTAYTPFSMPAFHLSPRTKLMLGVGFCGSCKCANTVFHAF